MSLYVKINYYIKKSALFSITISKKSTKIVIIYLVNKFCFFVVFSFDYVNITINDIVPLLLTRFGSAGMVLTENRRASLRSRMSSLQRTHRSELQSEVEGQARELDRLRAGGKEVEEPIEMLKVELARKDEEILDLSDSVCTLSTMMQQLNAKFGSKREPGIDAQAQEMLDKYSTQSARRAPPVAPSQPASSCDLLGPGLTTWVRRSAAGNSGKQAGPTGLTGPNSSRAPDT